MQYALRKQQTDTGTYGPTQGYFRKKLILFYDLYLRILTKIPVR